MAFTCPNLKKTQTLIMNSYPHLFWQSVSLKLRHKDLNVNFQSEI